ncbi:sugar kinase [Marinimicrobium sp. ABcell2]|uniref:sugar kinase n=1 Tax=Marinimicrobium sp. ABcell2 TaxID=3069751 RepID=UPI0027AEABE5|nr:sugar kinase [Marinimicrobium sp. ABcell2]MDQ2077478.1 sugar kinase [Marinimicrobium sp. ABcell2]
MSQRSQQRFVVVHRKSRMQELVQRFNTWPQARFYLEHNHVDVQDYLDEHDVYQQRLSEVERCLKERGRFQWLERGLLPNYQFSPDDIVVVIGQDGLVANTLKYLKGQRVIAINPDPARWDGQLLPFKVGDLEEILAQVEANRARIKSVTFAEASTNDGQTMLAVNDLFIGPKSHTSARYRLSWNGQTENHSSSGIIVSTGMGSSGWFQSILAGAMGVTGEASHPLKKGFAWDDRWLQFAVREPFPSQNTGTSLVFGEVTESKPLTLESLMPENGVVFSDGVEQDYISFNSGCILTIGISQNQGSLVSP